ncbi:Fic family protein [Opitutaceae bacterium TAV4]|nr:Fic family protein [Opitutaceae bacterium TAV3]RRK01268.1 Fic family protein [Opitutaceae bacterium TAV4]
MPEPQQVLAAALQRVRELATGEVVRGPDILPRDRLLLTKRGFLVEIIKGWYALTTPQVQPGDTTFWHAHFWGFVSTYLRHRFGTGYSLSAEHSLDLWTGNTPTPAQLIVIASKGGASTLQLPNRTSLLIYADKKRLPSTTASRQGVQVMPLATALVRVSPAFFRHAPTSAEIALRLVRPDDLSRVLLSESGSLAAAGRLVGAFRHCGLADQADRLAADLTAAGLEFEADDPFVAPPRLPPGLLFASPHVGRLKALWQQMRPVAHELFPSAPGRPEANAYLDRVAEIYTHDAYHSLSIEGYQVTPELIALIASGEWNLATDSVAQEQVNAMAAKGYHEAFKTVMTSVREILVERPAPAVVSRDLPNWYRALFSPSVQAGLLPAYSLAGYRNRPVFIRGSEHVPPPHEAVPELLDTLFDMLAAEPAPGVQAVLGHFLFVYIHPYSDGNGRIGRFILNTMLAAGGYPWTVIRVERRRAYMSALENASVRHDISDFARFVAEEMAASAELKGPKR